MWRKVSRSLPVILRRIRSFTPFGVYLLAYFLLLTGNWIHRKFGTPSFEQILFHLQFGFDGVEGSDPRIIRSFAMNCLVAPVVLAGLSVWLEKLIIYIHQNGVKQFLVRAGEMLNQGYRRLFWLLYQIVRLRLYLVLLLLAAGTFLYKVSFFSYAQSLFGKDYFSEYFVDPANVVLTMPKKPKNLVLIYVESLEETYSDARIFGRNLISLLSPEAMGGVSFSDYRQAPGTGWTIGGIVATQCGVPLKSVSLLNGNALGEAVEGFMPGAKCLADFLKEQGYKNIFVGGASLSFAGKGKFLKQHGYDELWGREEWIRLGESPERMNEWGLYDDDLLRYAQIRLNQLEAAGAPFNLTLLTLDTHDPEGFASRYCARKGVQNLEDIFECTAEQVADFVTYVRKKGYLKNTNIVIVGDHLGIANALQDKLDQSGHRSIFNLFVTDEKIEKNRERLLHFDLFPTILESLGFDVPDDRLGLGYSAWGAESHKPPSGRFVLFNKELLNYSDAYMKLWRESSK